MVDLFTGAVSTRATWWSRLLMWLASHRFEAQRSVQDMWGAPVSSLMTLLVLGIALALPTGLSVALKNGQHVAGGLGQSTQITVYLRNSVSASDGQRFSEQLRADKSIKQTRYVTREQSLLEFKSQSSFGQALDFLDSNPLPAVVIVQPIDNIDPSSAEALLMRLRVEGPVEQAQLDLEWLRKLHALMQLGQRAVMVLSILLGLAVLLIVGNTIRLAIQNRRAEIEVFKLVGATNAFIRRPFLYSGLWFGLVGGLLAYAMVSVALWWLDAPASELASLYQSDFRVQGLSLADLLRLLGFGTLLGLGGSLLSVNRHLRDIEPR